LYFGRTELCDVTTRLVEYIACNPALGHYQVLAPSPAGPHTRPGHSVSEGRKRIILYTSRRIRISTDEHCTAKAHIELIANSKKTIDKLKAEPGGIDVGMPVGVCIYSEEMRCVSRVKWLNMS
jgi:hypothetical protein